ncbi:MAG: insulinase family protein [Bacteroidales bacterium]|nr:insulinase family protein [Bacteroidales bacterium]
MKKLLNIALAALVLVALSACSSRYETVKNDPLGTKIYTLDNGLKVFMSVNKEQPRIQTYIAVKVGGKNDPYETTGLAHYFEHLMFKGTESFGTSNYEAEKPMLDEIEQLFEVYRKTTDEQERLAIYHRIDSISYEASKIAIPNEYDKLMAVIGANGTNAWTSMDETVYTEDIPSNQIDNWARIQADRFRNNVIRGFHTELETIYEEKNMSLTQDSRKIWEALDANLFPNHPYGRQTVLGTQENLKNPSITNVKKYHDTYYVPNNIAICVSGDFNPDEMVAAIEKYFGDWEPNQNLPKLEFEPEQPITEPVVKDVYGLESEYMALGWRLPGAAADLKKTAISQIASSVMHNGQAGLLDLDIVQQQKALAVYASSSIQPDYSSFIMMGYPKQGQTLEEVRALLLEEVAKLRNGEFDEGLLKATINNIKLQKMYELQDNSSRAVQYVNAFINGIDWKDMVNDMAVYESVTKDDVVAWANEFLAENAYVAVNKRQGEDTTVQKIAAPKITPIATNRDARSAFLDEIQNSTVTPIEPVFVDFNKDMSNTAFCNGVNILYKQNEINDIFTVEYVFNSGSANDPVLSLACDYLSYLGTENMSAEEFAKKMYSLACSVNFRVQGNYTYVSVSGLSENMKEAMELVENLIANAKADENILLNCKSDLFKSRFDAKTSQRACYSALRKYLSYGPEYIASSVAKNEVIEAVTSEQLLGKIRDLYGKSHEIIYYGPASETEVKDILTQTHKVAENPEELPETHTPHMLTSDASVIMTQYDAKQIYYLQTSNRGEKYDVANAPELEMYNEYFGGGMNSIVFQEMREARGLAYSAYAYMYEPDYADGDYYFTAFIATQNDKMRTAIEAFDEIINNMPESEAAFSVAKEALIGRLRTERTTGESVLWKFRSCRKLGLSEVPEKLIFEKVQNMTLADVKAAQEKWVKDRKYTYAILGDIKDLDVNYLKTLGPVKTVSLEEIFGY